MNSNDLKQKLARFLSRQGADLVGFAPAELWDREGPGASSFSPNLIWPPAQTVVVAGMGLPLPVVETTPSSYHMELYKTCNRELDSLAFITTRYLIKNNIAASYFPRDGFGSIKILKDRPHAAFDHRTSAYFAGLGTMGMSNNILTPRFGPRVRFVSILLDRALPPDPPLEADLCIRCRLCIKLCPARALRDTVEKQGVEFLRENCRRWHERLNNEHRYPCGVCIKVCPVGRDRRVYGAEKRSALYLKESEAIGQNSDDPLYRSWAHARSRGSKI